MLFRLFSRTPPPGTTSGLYGTIVAQSRLPCFYRDYAVSDTVNGRFELIILHLTLVLDRLFAEPSLRADGQQLFDVFCRDMDDNLREMGVGDLSVPKKMRRIGDAFYGRSRAYLAALKPDDDAQLRQALARNVYDEMSPDDPAPRRLAAYMWQAYRELTEQPVAALARGELQFPNPEVVAPR